MSSEKKPKWDIGVAVAKGETSVKLTGKYAGDLASRFSNDESAQHEANVIELADRRAGQEETLNTQKTKTVGQETAINDLHNLIMSIRGVVKSKDAASEISQAYGVGKPIWKTVPSVTASGKMVLTAYNKYTEWSNKIKILPADITLIENGMNILLQAKKAKGDSEFDRKAQTKDKNTLQREVEDTVTQISAIGTLIFGKNDPAVAALFADLIPASSTKAEKQTEITTETTTEAKA